MGSASVGVQCPLTFSLGEFLGYWAGSGILCWCPSPFPLPSISGCYVHSSSPAIEFHSYFFFTADVSAPIRSIFHLLCRRVSRLGTGHGTHCRGPRGGTGIRVVADKRL